MLSVLDTRFRKSSPRPLEVAIISISQMKTKRSRQGWTPGHDPTGLQRLRQDYSRVSWALALISTLPHCHLHPYLPLPPPTWHRPASKVEESLCPLGLAAGRLVSFLISVDSISASEALGSMF